MIHTISSLKLVQSISNKLEDNTFHHHYYILYDIINCYPKNYKVNYVEIGCYAGASACLMLQRPNTNVISIDLGYPISPNIVHSNIEKMNKLNNSFKYIKGNSQSVDTIKLLQQHVDEIDILFIDGDHSYQGVINDFLLYEQLVKTGGYIIFDDYNDWKYSPEVKLAVDSIIPTLEGRYKIIGTLPNKFKARPDWLTEGNDFIIQKLGDDEK